MHGANNLEPLGGMELLQSGSKNDQSFVKGALNPLC